MNYARYGATIHSITILHPQSPSTSNLVLGGGESAVETLNIWGGWREQPNARLPNDGLQDACSVVVSSPTSPYSSYIHLLGGPLQCLAGYYHIKDGHLLDNNYK